MCVKWVSQSPEPEKRATAPSAITSTLTRKTAKRARGRAASLRKRREGTARSLGTTATRLSRRPLCQYMATLLPRGIEDCSAHPPSLRETGSDARLGSESQISPILRYGKGCTYAQ